ncbi:hypothetical protein DFAR_1850003 [Desulfarculales bacterium]
MEAACLRAFPYGAFSSRSGERIIDKELDTAPLLTPAPEAGSQSHPSPQHPRSRLLLNRPRKKPC